MPLPLQDHEILNTASVSAAKERVGSVYCDHQLVPLSSTNRTNFHACHHYAPIDKVSVNFMTYSAKVLINPGYLKDFYLLQLPLQGCADIETGPSKFLSTPTKASLISPSEETRMVWDEGCAKLLVQIKRSALEQQLSKLAQCEIHKPLVFKPEMPIANPKVNSWWRFIQFLIADIDSGCFYDWGTIEKTSMESTLITNLLYAIPHNYSTVLENATGAIAPKQVKVAEAFMLENLGTAITIDDLVEVTGVSARSLFDSFKRFRGMTPMKRFLQLKLQQVRIDLQQHNQETTVTNILTKYGITQQGRFAAYYKNTFGETPSQTLKNT